MSSNVMDPKNSSRWAAAASVRTPGPLRLASETVMGWVVGLLFMSLLVVCSCGCPRKTDRMQSAQSQQSDLLDEETEDLILLPYLRGAGLPAVCLRDHEGATEGSSLFSNPIGLPFVQSASESLDDDEYHVPPFPRVAIWKTVRYLV